MYQREHFFRLVKNGLEVVFSLISENQNTETLQFDLSKCERIKIEYTSPSFVGVKILTTQKYGGNYYEIVGENKIKIVLSNLHNAPYLLNGVAFYGSYTLSICSLQIDVPSNVSQGIQDLGTISQVVVKSFEIGSGGGGTKDYNELNNKPKINNVELLDNKSTSQLGITDSIELYINPANNEMTVRLKSGDTTISEQTDTIPTASVVQNAYFDYTTQELVIIFTNGSELRLPFGELVGDMLPMAFNIQLPSAGWQQITGTDNYELDLTQAINYILGLIPVYNVVIPEGTENPSEEGWYEKNSQGQYVLTEDTSVVEGKTYYELLHKTLTYNTKFDLALNSTNQSILDASECEQIYFETYLDNGTPKIRAIAIDNSPSNDLVVQFTMTQIVPNLQGQPLLSNAIRKSGKNYVEKNLFLNTLFPKGFTIVTWDKKSPSTFIGGTWELISEGYYPVATVKDTINEQTERFKEAGLPDITGSMPMYVKTGAGASSTSALYQGEASSNNPTAGSSAGFNNLFFKASRNNSIYGASNTVQPKSVLCYWWVRTDNDILTYNFTNISFKDNDFNVSETGQVSLDLNNLKSTILDIFFPIGTVYGTQDDSFNPNTSWGGTWILLDKNQVLWSVGNEAKGGNNFAEQLPNITGSIYYQLFNKGDTPTGAYKSTQKYSASRGYQNGSTGYANVKFDASDSNSVYTDNGIVRPKGTGTHFWKRTA